MKNYLLLELVVDVIILNMTVAHLYLYESATSVCKSFSVPSFGHRTTLDVISLGMDEQVLSKNGKSPYTNCITASFLVT